MGPKMVALMIHISRKVIAMYDVIEYVCCTKDYYCHVKKKENGGKYHVLYCFEFHHFIHSHLVNTQKGKRHECQICLCVYIYL